MEFTRADTARKAPTRLVLADWGLEKVGKTSLGLSAPDPLYIFNFDWGCQELLESGRYEDREIYLINYPLPSKADPKEHKPLLTQFEAQWKEAVAQASARGGTVVLDTADELWGVVGNALTLDIREERHAKNAESEREVKDTRLDWRPANVFMDAVLKRPLQFPNVNAIYIQRAQEVYDAGGKATGTFKMHGFKTTAYIAEVVMQLYVKKNLVNGKLEGSIKGTIEACRFGQKFVGKELADPDYGMLMDLFS